MSSASAKRIEAVSNAVNAHCTAAKTLITRWVASQEQLCGILEGLLGYVEGSLGEAGAVSGGEVGWGMLADLPGCVEGVRKQQMVSIDDLIRSLRGPLEVLAETASALMDASEQALAVYTPVAGSPLLHNVFLITGSTMCDHLSALRATAVFRLQTQTLRSLCAFPNDLETLAPKVEAALEEAQACSMVQWELLLPIYP